MTTWKKELSFLLVGMMIMSGLVAFSAPVIAAPEATLNSNVYTITHNDGNMISHPEIADSDEWPIEINEWGTGAGNDLIYLGDDSERNLMDIQFEIQGPGALLYDTEVDITAHSSNTLITMGTDNSHTMTAGATTTIDFEIVVGTSGNVEGLYQMVCRLTEDEGGGNEDTSTIPFWIYISSTFHDDNAVYIDLPFELPYVVDDDGDDTAPDPFEAGDEFKEASVRLYNDADHAIDELNGTLTSTDARITLEDGFSRKSDGVGANANGYLYWRLDVDERTPPGEYPGTLSFTYLRTDYGFDMYITENPRDINYMVDFSFADDDPMPDDKLHSQYQCYVSDVSLMNTTKAMYPAVSIEQPTDTDEVITVNVTITNNGNQHLYNVQYRLAVTNPLWDYFRNPRIYYNESVGPAILTDDITIEFPRHNMGTDVYFEIEVIVVKHIPIGEHRLPIIYDGFYYDNAALGGSTQYLEVNGGNALADGNDDLWMNFSVVVTDEFINCHIPANGITTPTGDAGDKGDITAETVQVTIMNDEAYPFIDIRVRANFTGTPWYMPVINMGDPWVWANEANPSNPEAEWAADGNLTVTFDVDTDPNMTPDRYPFQLEITAVINNTLREVTVIVDYTRGAVIDFSSYGPRLQISALAADEIVPGKAFDMVLTVENVGDDTLRDVSIVIPCDDTDEYDWDLEADFKEQFDWSGVFDQWGGPPQTHVGHGGEHYNNGSGGVTWSDSEFPSEMFYTMESLDVDNVREIVEINLYMDGVYSKPGAVISLIRINDLAPGASFDVTYEMFADKDMVNGKPYMINVTVCGIDSEGDPANETLSISVMSSLPGKTYNPVELNWFDAGLKALALFLFFIIVLAILLFVYNMFKGEPYDEDDEDFDFEDDEPLEPMPEPMSEESPETLDTTPSEPEPELIEP